MRSSRMDRPSATTRHLLLLGAIELLVFSPCLPSGYFLDDFLHVENARRAALTLAGLAHGFEMRARQVHDGWAPKEIAGGKVAYFRPLFVAGLKLDHALGGAPWISHLHGIILHAMATAIVYLLFLEFFPAQNRVAFFSSLLFGLHPQNVFTVVWISARTEILSGFFMLLGLLAFLRYRRQQGPGAYALSLVCMVLALLSKENALIFPFLVLAADFLLAPDRPVMFRYHLPFFALTALYVATRTAVLGGFPTPPPGFIYHPVFTLDFIPFALGKTVCTVGGLFFLGPTLWWFQPWLEAHPLMLTAYTATVALSTLWIFWQARSRMAWFLGFWIVIAIAPSLPLIGSTHYLYFVMPAAICLFVLMADRIADRHAKPAQRLRLRRAVWILSGTFAVGAFSFAWLVNPFCRLGQTPAEEICRAIPNPPEGARFYFVDLPLLGVDTTSYLRMLYGRDDIQGHILSLGPDLLKATGLEVAWTTPQTLHVRALGPAYFTDPFTRLLVRAEGGIPEGARASAGEYDIVAERVETDREGIAGVRALRYEFHEPLDAKPRLFFLFTRDGIRRLALPPARNSPVMDQLSTQTTP